jgi:predicted esterase YcpF (UPF0227 family)
MLGQALAQAGRSTDFVCPQLPASPAEAMAVVLGSIAPRPDDVVVGSSLGGYYARYVAEHCQCRAVLLNPSIRPDLTLASHLGAGTSYHDSAPFEFRPEYLEELRRFAVPQVSHPERCLLVAATGDEVLDWRDMVQAWDGAQHWVILGSDHGISDFARHINRVLDFAGIARAGAA